jgi:hypothetical protein
MSDRTVTTTSARKKAPRPKGPPPNVAMIAVGVVIGIMVLIVVFRSGEEDQREGPPPTPTRVVRKVAPATPAATPPFAPVFTPGGEDDGFGLATDTPTPEPQTTARGSSDEACVSFRWTTGLRAGAEDDLPIEVTLTNSCAYDLESVNLVFVATGYRGGEAVQTVQGTFGGALAQGEAANFTIVLPALPGGFDRVDLQPGG